MDFREEMRVREAQIRALEAMTDRWDRPILLSLLGGVFALVGLLLGRSLESDTVGWVSVGISGSLVVAGAVDLLRAALFCRRTRKNMPERPR